MKIKIYIIVITAITLFTTHVNGQFLNTSFQNDFIRYVRSCNPTHFMESYNERDELSINPIFYYFHLGIISEYRQEWDSAYFYFKTSYHLADEIPTTEWKKGDIKLVKKVRKLEAEDCGFANIYLELENKIKNSHSNLQSFINLQEELIENLEEKKDSINNVINKKEAEKDSLNELKRTKITIKNINVNKKDEVTSILEDVKKLNKDTKYTLFDSTKIKVDFNRGINDQGNIYELEAYDVGKACSKEIQDITKSVMSELLNQNIEKPEDVKLTIQIIGLADGICCDCEWGAFNGNPYFEKKDYTFYIIKDSINIDYSKIYSGELSGGKKKDTDISIGSKLNNERLAFLRAYCSYNIIKQICEEKGFKPTYIFYAVKFDCGIEGPKYRGVKINLTIENLFKHNNDKVESLSQEIFGLEEQYSKIENQIELERTKLKDMEEFNKNCQYKEGTSLYEKVNKIKNNN